MPEPKISNELNNPDSQKQRSPRKMAYLSLLINVTIWGAALPVVKPALSYVSPYQYLFYRYLVAAPFAIPFLVYLLAKHKPSLKMLFTILAMEILGVTGYLSLLYEGLKLTTSLEATLLANTSAIFIILGGVWFLKEKEERRELIGLSLAIAGTILLTFEPIISGRNHFGFGSFTGNLLILTANLFWAAYVLLAKRVYKNVPKLLVGFLSPWVGLLTFFVLVLITKPGLTLSQFPQMILSDFQNFPVLAAALYMSLLGSIVAVPAYIYGNSLIEASEASLFTYLQPLVTIPLATLWLNEPLNLIMITALIFSTSGVYIAEKRKKITKIN